MSNTKTLVPAAAALGVFVGEHSNKEVAEDMGVTTGAITNWTRGYSTPEGDDLKLIEDYLAKMNVELPDGDQPNPHYIGPRALTEEVVKLRRYAKRHNLDAKALAPLIGIESSTTVKKWLESDTPPSYPNKGKLIVFLTTGNAAISNQVEDVLAAAGQPTLPIEDEDTGDDPTDDYYESFLAAEKTIKHLRAQLGDARKRLAIAVASGDLEGPIESYCSVGLEPIVTD